MNLVAPQHDQLAGNREIIMIPYRNKPEQPAVGDFIVEHEHARRQVARALQVGGRTVIVAADQPGLTAYYVARILEQLSALERNVAPMIRVPSPRAWHSSQGVSHCFACSTHHGESHNAAGMVVHTPTPGLLCARPPLAFGRAK